MNSYMFLHLAQETNQVEYIIPEESSLEDHLRVTDAGFIDFVRSLLEINPQRRATAKEALEHPWLSHTYESKSWISCGKKLLALSILKSTDGGSNGFSVSRRVVGNISNSVLICLCTCSLLCLYHIHIHLVLNMYIFFPGSKMLCQRFSSFSSFILFYFLWGNLYDKWPHFGKNNKMLML